MRYEILGPLVVRDGTRVVSLARGRLRLLLAVLLLRANEVISSERLIDVLWGESPPAAAAGSLHNLTAALRKALGEGVLATRGGGYMLVVGEDELDAWCFEALAEQGRTALVAGEPERAAGLLRDALALWRGAPLADLAYEAALQAEMGRLEELRLVVLEERIEADLVLGRHLELVPELNALVAEWPLRERLRAQQILALYRCGRQAEALEAYGAARRRLVDELGIEPGPALRRLERAVLEQDPALGAPDRLPRPPVAVPTRRRALALIAAGTLTLIVAGVFVLTRAGSGARGLAAVAGDSVVAIDPHTDRIVADIPVGGTPTSVAAGRGAAWVLNADDQTIARVDRHGSSVRTVGIGATPTDIAAAGGDLWVGAGDTGYGATRVLRLGADDLRERSRVDLPAQRHQGTPGLPGQVVVGRRAVWAINGSGELARIDVRTGERTAVASLLEARALALGTGALWAPARDDNTLLRLDPDTGALRGRLKVPATHLDALAAGAGAVWATDSYDGTLWRIDPGTRLNTRTIAVGAGTDGVAVGDGAVWTINGLRGTLTRVDPRRNRVVATIDLGSTPRDVDAGGDTVWATVAGAQSVAAAVGAGGGPTAVPGPACGRVLAASGQAPQYLIASDFALQNGDHQGANAVAFVLRRHGFRAGRFRVGYQSCDSSTADSGQSDPGKCASNAKAYAADRALIGVVGPYNSGCALVEIPILNRAAGGPLALVSPSTSAIGLTHLDPNAPQGALARLYPTGVRNFARIVPSDDQEAAAGAVLARQLGVRRVYVLDDGIDMIRDEWALPFRRSAAALGLRVVGAATWDPRGTGFRPLVQRIRRARPQAVYLGGLPGSHGGTLVAALRARLGASFPLIAPNPFTAIAFVYAQAGRAARGLYVTNSCVPATRLGPRGRAFAREFAATQPGAPLFDDTAYAAAATELLLAAIAHSNGTRTGVVRALATTRLSDGILGPLRLDHNGDRIEPPVALLRLVRPEINKGTAYAGAVIDRLIVPPRTRPTEPALPHRRPARTT